MKWLISLVLTICFSVLFLFYGRNYNQKVDINVLDSINNTEVELIDDNDNVCYEDEIIDSESQIESFDEIQIKKLYSHTPAESIHHIECFGILKWTNDSGNVYPLEGVTVRIEIPELKFFETKTDKDGYYRICVDSPYELFGGHFNRHICFYNDKFDIIKDNNEAYDYDSVEYIRTSQFEYNYTFSGRGGYGGAAQVFEAMYNYTNYAQSLLNDNEEIPYCSVVYPGFYEGVDYDKYETCYYEEPNNKIILASEYEKSQFSNVTVAGSWDTIGHEYGHHLQFHYFCQEYNGIHDADKNGILNYLINEYKREPNNKNIVPTYDDCWKIKEYGCGLGLVEGWATYFAIKAQESFPDKLKTIKAINGNVYDDYDGIPQNYNFTLKERNSFFRIEDRYLNIDGESDEFVITAFFLKMCDGVNLNDKDLWDLMRFYNPANLGEVIYYLLNDSTFKNKIERLGYILESLELASAPKFIENASYNTLPTFEWSRSNSDVDFEKNINIYDSNDESKIVSNKRYYIRFYYENNVFEVEFYDESNNLLFNKKINNGHSYKLNWNEWNQILSAPGSTYKVRIQASNTSGFTSGPFISAYHEFKKPKTTINSNIEINNLNYYEKSFTIPEGEIWCFNIMFNRSGNKLIQTFGNLDTVMELYDSTGSILLASSDNEGYGNNSFIYEYFEENKYYMLTVGLYDSSSNGTVKLAIVPTNGISRQNANEISSYEDIFNTSISNHLYDIYIPQYEVTIMTWTPSVTGIYEVLLSSNIDSFLYVINPNSTKEIEEEIDYCDDYCLDEDQGRYLEDGIINGHYYSDITYFVIIARNVNNAEGVNLRINFDFSYSL